MKQIVLVFLGGGIGSILRYLISKTFNPNFQHFFLGTFIANTLGCLVIGIILGFSLKSNYINANHTLFLATGFCGGLTTFSSFAFEKNSLLQSGELFYFSMYTIASIATGVLAVVLGLWLSKIL